MRMIVSGADGRMGQILIQQLVQEGEELAAAVSRSYPDDVSAHQYASFASMKETGDVVIDFSHHSTVQDFLPWCIAHHVPAVIATTGHTAIEKAMIADAAKQIPILGVNTGRLGFLADVKAQEIERTIDALYEGDYAIDTRAVIKVETDGQPLKGYCCALNDVAILKRDNASMITIHATVNGDYLTTYQADGLIMSTPTGSTAYSLSNGGPIIVPGTHVFSLTAVAPHSLNVRPIVFSEDCEIKLTVESRTQNYLVALDGRSEKLPDTTRLTLRKAPYRVKVIKRAGTKYFHTLREKMMWGADQRG